jgi:Zn-dependent protease
VKIKWNIKSDHILFFVLMLLVIFFQIKGSFPLQRDWYREKAIAIPFILLCIMIRKIIQNLTAHQLGDMELKINNQKIWNPLLMIDWVGFLPFVFLNFGWAKPIDSLKANSGDKRWVRLQIIGSGLLANLFFALLFKSLYHIAEIFSLNLAAYMNVFAIINMNYFLFSLLPIPPLDGWLLFKAIQKGKVRLVTEEIYGYSLLIVIYLTNFQKLLLPISKFLLHWF